MKTKFIGHRGSLGFSVENTKVAFLGGVSRNVYGLECDIRISTDKVFFIMHDDTLNRFIPGDEKNVWEYSINELLEKELIQEFNGTTYFGKICLLEEFINICKNNNKHAIIEIKYSPELSNENVDMIHELINLINKYEYLENTTIISFQQDCLIKIRELYPNINIQLLVCGKILDYLEVCDKYNFDLDTCYDETVNKENVDLYHKHNHLINIWTVDNKDDANKLIEVGVDFITSNLLS